MHYSNLEEERRANKRFVELETVGDEQDFADALVGRGCECVPAGPGRLKMVLPAEFELREIYRLAADRDLQLRRLNYRRDTLEDIFLKAMEIKYMAVYKRTYTGYSGDMTPSGPAS